MIDLALLLADGAQPAAAGSWLTPELAGFLAALLASLAANVLSALGRREAAARAAAAAPLLGSVAGAIAMVRREGRLDAVSQAALLGALKQTSGALGVGKHLDAVAAAANAVQVGPDGKVDPATAARTGLDAARAVLTPPPAAGVVADVVRRVTGRAALLLIALGLAACDAARAEDPPVGGRAHLFDSCAVDHGGPAPADCTRHSAMCWCRHADGQEVRLGDAVPLVLSRGYDATVAMVGSSGFVSLDPDGKARVRIERDAAGRVARVRVGGPISVEVGPAELDR